MIKGDSQLLRITIKINNEPVKLGDNDKITFTTKYSPEDENYIIQKGKELNKTDFSVVPYSL